MSQNRKESTHALAVPGAAGVKQTASEGKGGEKVNIPKPVSLLRHGREQTRIHSEGGMSETVHRGGAAQCSLRGMVL